MPWATVVILGNPFLVALVVKPPRYQDMMALVVILMILLLIQKVVSNGLTVAFRWIFSLDNCLFGKCKCATYL